MSDLDYRLRPKKAAERAMLCRAMHRVQIFENISQYQYIGFGALFYVDHKLFHKELGIKTMVNIEKRTSPRYQFNSPFDFVHFVPGYATNVWHKIDLTRKSVVWLDYLSMLTNDTLSDLNTLVDSLPVYSIVYMTVNHMIAASAAEEDSFRQLEKDLGGARVGGESISSMCTDELPNVYRRVLRAEIDSAIRRRNSIDSDAVSYVELCSLRYRDNAPMMTYGFIIVPVGKKTVVRNAFKGLPYMFTKDFYTIDFPMMTIKEQFMLTAERRKMMRRKIFSKHDLRLFYRHQQYIPYFTETVL